MKNPRLKLSGALVIAALVAPTLSAADSTGKKKPFWNRLRQPKQSAPAQTPPPADAANATAAPAAATGSAATTTAPATTAAGATAPAAAAATPPAGAAPTATATPPPNPAPSSAPTAAVPPPAPAGAPPPAGVAPAGAAAPATAPVPAPTAEAAGDPNAAVPVAAAVAAVGGKPEKITSGDRDIDRIIARMRTGPLGQEPSVIPYLDLIGSGQATAAEMNDFSSYIARKGLVEDAVVIQKRAIELDSKNTKLWLNLGLLERGAGRPAPAGKAFQRAVELFPANGPAWYNLGVIQDGDGQYDAAIESFRRALTIDPTLGDPRFNPQAITNNRLLVVRLMLAQQTAGTRSLALTAPMQEPYQPDTTKPETVPAPEDKPAPSAAMPAPPPDKK